MKKPGTYYRLRVQGQDIVDAFSRFGVLPRKYRKWSDFCASGGERYLRAVA